MPTSRTLTGTLQKWIEVVIGRSMRAFVQQSKKADLSFAQLSTLMRIHRKGALTVSAIGEDLGITNAAASQMAERLMQKGLISRLEDPLDRRVRKIEITPKGRAVLDASLKARQDWLEGLAAALSPAEREQVAAALQLLIEKAAQIEPVPPP